MSGWRSGVSLLLSRWHWQTLSSSTFTPPAVWLAIDAACRAFDWLSHEPLIFTTSVFTCPSVSGWVCVWVCAFDSKCLLLNYLLSDPHGESVGVFSVTFASCSVKLTASFHLSVSDASLVNAFVLWGAAGRWCESLCPSVSPTLWFSKLHNMARSMWTPKRSSDVIVERLLQPLLAV